MGRPVTPHNSNSQQSRAGMPDEGLGVAGIGLEHFKAAVASYVGDLDQVSAEVTKPARRLWPAKAAVSSPSLAAAALTMVATLRATRRRSVTRCARLLKTRRKTAPSVIPAASSHVRSAATGHAIGEILHRAQSNFQRAQGDAWAAIYWGCASPAPTTATLVGGKVAPPRRMATTLCLHTVAASRSGSKAKLGR